MYQASYEIQSMSSSMSEPDTISKRYIYTFSRILDLCTCASHACFQTRPEATRHYNAKVDFVRDNIEKLQEALTKKQDNMQYVVNIIHVKEQQAIAAASGQRKDS